MTKTHYLFLCKAGFAWKCLIILLLSCKVECFAIFMVNKPPEEPSTIFSNICLVPWVVLLLPILDLELGIGATMNILKWCCMTNIIITITMIVLFHLMVCLYMMLLDIVYLISLTFSTTGMVIKYMTKL